MGLVGGVVAILVMVLALAGVIPRPIFFLAAAGLVAVAYKLDQRFKANAPSPVAPPLPTSPLMPTPPPAATTPTSGPPPVSAAAPTSPSVHSPTDLQAEHARLTQELTDRVDADEDVRFEKFMRLRAIEQELLQQTPPP
jgi:hypothetical protein